MASIAEAGRITHPANSTGGAGYAPPIGRSVVIGDKLFTLSYAGLAANSLDALTPLSFTAFPAPPAGNGSSVGSGPSVGKPVP